MGVNPLDPTLLGKLDPHFVKFYEEVIDTRPATHQVPLEEIRSNPTKWVAPWALPVPENERIRTQTIPSKDGYLVPVRIYHPDPDLFGQGPQNVHLNFHGGGFVFGSLEADARFCVTVQQRVGLVVVDVNYRHCPEAKFGENIEDSWAALNWVRTNAKKLNVNPESMSIGGISAGAHICCVLQHICRDAEIPLKLAVLSVPVCTDFATYRKPSDSPFESYTEFSKAPMLNWERMHYFGGHLFTVDEDATRASIPNFWIEPLNAPNFAGLCETFLITAECDPVRDEGEAYGKKLHVAGTKVTFKRYLGMPHPFMHMTEQLEQARQYDRDVIDALHVAHGSIGMTSLSR